MNRTDLVWCACVVRKGLTIHCGSWGLSCCLLSRAGGNRIRVPNFRIFIIVVICIFFDSPATLSSLRAQNVGTLMILLGRGWLRTSLTCFIHFWARRCSKTCISKFWNARRCRKKRISFCRPSPLAGFSGGDHLKL